MVIPLRKPRPTSGPVPAPGRQRYLLVAALCTAFSLALLVPAVAYWTGYEAGVRAADEEAVYRAVGEAVRLGTRVAALADTVSRLRRDMAVRAAQRLPPHVLDSLRALRWSTP